MIWDNKNKKMIPEFDMRPDSLDPSIRRAQGRRLNRMIRTVCLQHIRKDKLLQFLSDVASGRVLDHQIVRYESGYEVIELPASVKDRLDAAKYIIDRVAGKAPQGLTLDSGDGMNGTFILAQVNYGDKEKIENNHSSVSVPTEALPARSTESNR